MIADPIGDPHRGYAGGALSGDVDVERRECLIKVSRVLAHPDPDLEDLPGLVRLDREGAALEWPLGSVVSIDGIAGACLFWSEWLLGSL